MKKISIALAAIVVTVFSSCYVGVQGRHHATRVVIVADNNQKDSLQSPVTGATSQNDSLNSPANPKIVK